ncbi:hypothetical protein GCM10027190_12060 [Spirosoma areae]
MTVTPAYKKHIDWDASESTSPPLLTKIAREIKAVGGSIWLLLRLDYGSVIRAEIGGKQLRVVLRPLSGEGSAVPLEPHSALFVITTIDDLRTFLKTL